MTITERREAMDALEFEPDEERGYFVARGVLARTGVQLYRAAEIGLDGDPMRVIRVYRPHSEVFDSVTMASFENLPVTIDHKAMITADNWREHAVGEVRDIRREGNFQVGTVIVKDAAAIQAIKAGHSQLSNGYTNLLDFTPGVSPSGEEYDAIQRRIRGNHVALVRRARCGDACRLTGDSNEQEEHHMKEKLDEALAKVASLDAELAAKTTELTDAQGKLDVAESKVKELETKLSAGVATVDSAVALYETKLADAESKIKELTDAASPERILEAAKTWATMTADGEKIAPGYTPDSAGSVVDYQRAILRKVMDGTDERKTMILAITGGKTVCDSSADTVQSAFRLLASLPSKKSPSEIGKALTGDGESQADEEVLGAGLFHSRMLNGYK